MPRRKKKNNLEQKRNQTHLSMINTDFTVYDYASVSKPTNNWRSDVKQLSGQSAIEHCEIPALPDDWSECTDENYPQIPIKNPFEIARASLQLKGSGCVNGKTVEHKSNSGCVLPIDFWFLISEYISPEDIAVFARICRSTHVVVHSARFWRSIYRRFCRFSTALPPGLQPDCVEQLIHGLRTRVVRALFHAYPPLSSRVHHRSIPAAGASAVAAPPPHMVDPEIVVGRRCVLAWYEHFNKQHWRFFFRFEVSRRVICHLCPTNDGETDHLLAPDDVMHNVDERSVVLVAVTPHFVKLPVVMGQVLVKASVTADGMFARRLRLIFCSEYVHVGRGSGMPSGAVSVEIDPLHSIGIVHWWDPSFPSRR